MTIDQWKDELGRTLSDLGPWHVNSAWVERNSPMCVARIADASGRERLISLARDRFRTETERRAEIVRQLQAQRRAS